MCTQGIDQAEIAAKISCITSMLSNVKIIEIAVNRPFKLSAIAVLPNLGRKGVS